MNTHYHTNQHMLMGTQMHSVVCHCQRHHETPHTVLMMEHLITATRIRTCTHRDPLISRVLQYIQHGWPEVIKEDELKPFWRRKVELSCQDGCILWRNRVVVPKAGREEVLRELHDAHPGETRMKRIARMFVWWPRITCMTLRLLSRNVLSVEARECRMQYKEIHLGNIVL